MATARTPTQGEWTLPYTPRKEMEAFHQRTTRNAYLICHRRYGKTVACVAELILRALYTTKRNAQFAYVAPFRSQAKAVAWLHLVDMTDGLATEVKVSELSVTLPNGSKIFLTGSDNVNALRGLYLDGCVIDEFAQCRPSLLEAVIMPCLFDRSGWLVIIGTAYGRLNQFYDYREKAVGPDSGWFFRDLKITDTGLFSPEQQEEMRQQQSQAKYEQEFLNSFTAELTGTYYASILTQIEAAGQVSPDHAYDPLMTVQVAFDIGRGDSTVAWFWQERPDGIAVIDLYSNHGEPADHYIDMLKGKPYTYSSVWLPHDARAKTFATKKSALEQFLAAKLPTHITPSLSVEDGIEAARQTLLYSYFNAEACYEGIEALRMYRKKWDELNQCFSSTPLHDRSCFPAYTKVDTPQGPVCIGDLAPLQYVLVGGLTVGIEAVHYRQEQTIVIEFDDATELECTPQHKVFTTKGLVSAGSLRYGDELHTANEAIKWSLSSKGIRKAFTESFKVSDTDTGLHGRCTSAKLAAPIDSCTGKFTPALMEHPHPSISSPRLTGIKRISTPQTGRREKTVPRAHNLRAKTPLLSSKATNITETRKATTTIRGRAWRFIVKCTRPLMARYPPAWIYTILTRTKTIIASIISNAYLAANIRFCTLRPANGSAARPTKSSSGKQGERVLSGTGQKQAENGIANTPSEPGRGGSITEKPVQSATESTTRHTPPDQSIATPTVKRVRSVRVGRWQSVYDLTIPHHHAYVADGVLVSNSDFADSYRYLAIVAQKHRKPAPKPLLSAQNAPNYGEMSQLFAQNESKQKFRHQKMRL